MTCEGSTTVRCRGNSTSQWKRTWSPGMVGRALVCQRRLVWVLVRCLVTRFVRLYFFLNVVDSRRVPYLDVSFRREEKNVFLRRHKLELGRGICRRMRQSWKVAVVYEGRNNCVLGLFCSLLYAIIMRCTGIL